MDAFDPEHERILEAYEARRARARERFFTYGSPAHVLAHHERYRETLRILAANGVRTLGETKILDVGCGDGSMLRQFVQWGAVAENLAGIDLQAEPVSHARRHNPQFDVRCDSAVALPWEDASFDLVCQHTAFSSILDVEMKNRVANEMVRVLRPRGAVLWYDIRYDNPRNPDVRGVRASELRRLFSDLDLDLRRITLAPPIARHLPVALLPILYPLLSAVPPLRTHYLGVLTKR